MSSIITLSSEGHSKTEVKQSVFIGAAVRVDDPDSAIRFVDGQRDLYPDAKHTVYAWRVSGDQFMQKYSDDGEPQGTAAMPILTLIDRAGITNVAVAVTRYFGGILLGKGGLVRAYTDCAKLALTDSHPVELVKGISIGITVPYQLSDRLRFELMNLPCEIKDTIYLQDVRFIVDISADDLDRISSAVTDITGGVALIDKIGEVLIRGREISL